MKKQIYCALVFLIITVSAVAQDHSKLVNKRYSKEQLATWQTENPAYYSMLLFALDNAIYVIDKPEGKDIPSFASIAYDMKQPKNFIELGLEIKSENQYFSIEGTNKLLVVKSELVLKYEMNARK
jgi:hypothetical protein